MRTLILGAGGQLGTDLQRVMADWDVTPLTHRDLDVCDFDAVRSALDQGHHEVVINAAAYIRVDDAESQVEEAFRINAYAVRNLALACRDLDCELVHISTDYVFDGARGSPYTEDDCPNPLGVYGASKLAGESFVRSLCPRHLLVRSSGLYGPSGPGGKGANFVETMLRLAGEGRPIRVVSDQVLGPTYTKDLAGQIKGLIESGATGLYHVTNAGGCSWFEFAQRVFTLVEAHPELTSITSDDYRAAARRPAYSVLSSAKTTRALGSPPRSWEEALADYLDHESSRSQ